MTRQEAVRLLAFVSGWKPEDVIEKPHDAWWASCSQLGEARRIVEEPGHEIDRGKP